MEGERERGHGSCSHVSVTGAPGSAVAGGLGGEESTEITEGPDIASGVGRMGHYVTKHAGRTSAP